MVGGLWDGGVRKRRKTGRIDKGTHSAEEVRTRTFRRHLGPRQGLPWSRGCPPYTIFVASRCGAGAHRAWATSGRTRHPSLSVLRGDSARTVHDAAGPGVENMHRRKHPAAGEIGFTAYSLWRWDVGEGEEGKEGREPYSPRFLGQKMEEWKWTISSELDNYMTVG